MIKAITLMAALLLTSAAQAYDDYDQNDRWRPEINAGSGDTSDSNRTYTTIRNITYDNQGNNWKTIRNNTYGSDGTVCTRIRNQINCQ